MANGNIDTLSAENFDKYLEKLNKEQAVNDSLNNLGGNNAYKGSFSLTGNELGNSFSARLNKTGAKEEFQGAVNYVKNNETVTNNFVPFISIAAGEAMTKGARLFTDFKMPKTFAKGSRYGGVRGLAFMSAVRAH